MPPYWVNKALPTPSLTLPGTLFSTCWLFHSFLLRINAFPMWYEIWKGRKKRFGKRWVWTRLDCIKKHAPYQLHHWTDDWQMSFIISVDCPNHTLVGGVSVTSLSQQGGLFALSVIRHSIKEISLGFKINDWNKCFLLTFLFLFYSECL